MAKATLNINRERVTGRSYGCVADTRNGACPNRILSTKRIGEYGSEGYFTFGLCRRHDRMYDEEQSRLIGLIREEHEQGLHGTGDDRKAFAEGHVRSEFWEIRCKLCHDELASEGLGVSADQVEQAVRIKNLRDRHDKLMLNTITRFTERVGKDGPSNTIRSIVDFADTAASLHAADALWLRVDAYTEGAYGGLKLNVVDAYAKVAEEQRQRLIGDRISNAEERMIASRFVQQQDYTY
jgi:hypothetical protein